MGELANGETILSVGFEYSGELTQPMDEVTVTLPAALLEGCALSLLDADGAKATCPSRWRAKNFPSRFPSRRRRGKPPSPSA